MMTKESMTKMLRESEDGCEVTFNKVDGTERIMWCTLNPALMPKIEEKPKSEDKPKKEGLPESNDHVVAWDWEKSAWRSFRCDSLIMFNKNRSKLKNQ
jgi:hypothetical protein